MVKTWLSCCAGVSLSVLAATSGAQSLTGPVARVAPGGVMTVIVGTGISQLFCVTSTAINNNMEAMADVLAVAQTTGMNVKLTCGDNDGYVQSVLLKP